MTDRHRSLFLGVAGAIALGTFVVAQSPASTADEALARRAFDDSQRAWRSGKFDDALMQLTRIEKDFPTTTVAAEAFLEAGRALVAVGYPATAMQELQKVRTRQWPRLLEADVAALREVALARITLLQRIYLRPNAPFSGPGKPFGASVQNVFALRVSGKNAVYWAAERGVGPTTWAPLPPAKDLRGLTLDATGKPVVIDGGQLIGGPSDVLKVTRPTDKPEPLEKIGAAVQLASSGDWIVHDEDKGLLRFKNDGTYAGPFETGNRRVKALKLAINDFDEIAAIDRESPRIVLFNAAGAEIGEITEVRAEVKEPQDLTFDAFGHLYVLDQRTLVVLSPYAPAAGEAAARSAPTGAAAPKPAAAPASRADAYQLRVKFSEPEKSREGFHRGAALAVDRGGAVYVYDKELKQVLVYR
jgi:hypothetical protein